MVIAVGEKINLPEINAIASKPEQSNTFFVATETAIDDAVESLLDELC